MGLFNKFKIKNNESVPKVLANYKVCFDYICSNDEFKMILNRVITPELENRCYTYNGDYIWYSNWNNHMRHVIKVFLLKGYSAVFTWGICFDFIPLISSNRKSISYNRTDKSVNLHLFVNDYCNGIYLGKEMLREMRFGMNGMDKEDIYSQIRNAYNLCNKDMYEWFDNIHTLEDALDEARHQMQVKTLNEPRPIYVEAFLLAALGDYDSSVQEFKKAEPKLYEENLELAMKIEKKLFKISKELQ